MLSTVNSYRQPKWEYFGLPEKSKILPPPLTFSERLDGVILKIIEVVKQAEVGSIITLWRRSAGLPRRTFILRLNFGIRKERGLCTVESIAKKVLDEGKTKFLLKATEWDELVRFIVSNSQVVLEGAIHG